MEIKILTALLDAADGNLLLGFVPDSLGSLIFGVILIALAVGLRRLFKRNDERQTIEKFERTTEKIN